MSRASVLTVLCLFVALALAAACGGGEEGEEPTASPTAAVVETPGPGDVGELPEGFPEDFPLYEKATVRVATLAPEGDRFLVSMETEDSADKVRAFYEKELEKEPWQVENVQDIPEMETKIIEFARRDSPGQRGTVAIAVVHVDGQRSSIDLELTVAP